MIYEFSIIFSFNLFLILCRWCSVPKLIFWFSLSLVSLVILMTWFKLCIGDITLEIGIVIHCSWWKDAVTLLKKSQPSNLLHGYDLMLLYFPTIRTKHMIVKCEKPTLSCSILVLLLKWNLLFQYKCCGQFIPTHIISKTLPVIHVNYHKNMFSMHCMLQLWWIKVCFNWINFFVTVENILIGHICFFGTNVCIKTKWSVHVQRYMSTFLKMA